MSAGGFNLIQRHKSLEGFQFAAGCGSADRQGAGIYNLALISPNVVSSGGVGSVPGSGGHASQ